MSQLQELLNACSGKALANAVDHSAIHSRRLPKDVAGELFSILTERNGFYAYESALHVFPFVEGGAGANCDLLSWNSTSLWKNLHFRTSR